MRIPRRIDQHVQTLATHTVEGWRNKNVIADSISVGSELYNNRDQYVGELSEPTSWYSYRWDSRRISGSMASVRLASVTMREM